MSCPYPHVVGISHEHVQQHDEVLRLGLYQVLVIFGGQVLIEYFLVDFDVLVG
jgi:hypothetical protein